MVELLLVLFRLLRSLLFFTLRFIDASLQVVDLT